MRSVKRPAAFLCLAFAACSADGTIKRPFVASSPATSSSLPATSNASPATSGSSPATFGSSPATFGSSPAVADGSQAPRADAAVERTPVIDAAPASPPARPAIGSIGRVTWIYPRATRKSEPIGSIRPGTAVTLHASDPVNGEGCPRWYEVEPRGFVCLDSKATLALDQEPFKALASLSPNRSSPFPYNYAYSTGAPMYGRVPDTAQQVRVERGYRRVDKLSRDHKPRSGHEELATGALLTATAPPPYFAASGEFPRMTGQRAGALRWEIPEGAMLSFTNAFDVDGRTFLLSPDLSIVPADRVRPFRPSAFHGVELSGDVKLPIAWIRRTPKPKMRQAQDSSFAPTGDSWPVRSWIALTGKKVERGSELWLETRDQGLYIRQADATVVEPAAQLPFSVGADEKWIDASIDRGTLTLFVGANAVFTTLISPGAGGVPPSSAKTNEELVKGSYTPLGIYRVNFKVRETTMTPEKTPFPEKNWIADVPHTLYFRMPFAIHGAYWHEDFGLPKSGGCINLSPTDARFVFDWVEPKIPDEWSGVSGGPTMGLGTKVFIHR